MNKGLIIGYLTTQKQIETKSSMPVTTPGETWNYLLFCLQNSCLRLYFSSIIVKGPLWPKSLTSRINISANAAPNPFQNNINSWGTTPWMMASRTIHNTKLHGIWNNSSNQIAPPPYHCSARWQHCGSSVVGREPPVPSSSTSPIDKYDVNWKSRTQVWHWHWMMMVYTVEQGGRMAWICGVQYPIVDDWLTCWLVH